MVECPKSCARKGIAYFELILLISQGYETAPVEDSSDDLWYLDSSPNAQTEDAEAARVETPIEDSFQVEFEVDSDTEVDEDLDQSYDDDDDLGDQEGEEEEALLGEEVRFGQLRFEHRYLSLLCC